MAFMRLLIIEDEPVLADYLAQGLSRDGMAVDVCYDGPSGHDRLVVNSYDVVILDRDLPGISGDAICQRLAAEGDGHTRILMLTASGTVRDRVAGLSMGADDYLAKPFDYDELVARVRALSRRTVRALPPVLRHRGLTIDTARRLVDRDGAMIRLTPKEFAVLEVIVRAGGSVVSAEDLLEQAWDEHADPFTTAVRVTVSKLRAKLGEPPLIETVPGAGYRIER
jgi:DNA-binding response OmpR family regulator